MHKKDHNVTHIILGENFSRWW